MLLSEDEEKKKPKLEIVAENENGELIEETDVGRTAKCWTCRLNEPEDKTEKFYTDEEFFDYLSNMPEIKYFCFKREKGEQKGRVHFQFYVVFENRKNFNTVKNLLPLNSWTQISNGTKTENRNYCMKTETSIEGHKFYENGEFTEERTRTDLINIMALIQNGIPIAELRTLYPSQCFMHKKKLQELRNEYLNEKFAYDFRNITVNYVWGKTGSGKTQAITKKYGYRNIYRVTEYDSRAFDNYEGQDVIIFEEFRSSFKIAQMLNYLDGHPCRLPCRYEDKTACYTKVYILTNISLDKQYPNIQQEEPETWQAFKRRIHNVYCFDNKLECKKLLNDEPFNIACNVKQISIDDSDLPF